MKHKVKLFCAALMLSISVVMIGQTTGGFSYQAIARMANGSPLTEADIVVRFSIRLGGLEGTIFWQEDHDVHTTELGLFSVVIGGEDAYNQTGKLGSFDEINWSEGPYFLQLWLNSDKDFMDMGGSVIQTVPLARHAEMARHSAGNFSVIGETGNPDEALFEVKRADGMPVFAVYDEGVWVYADPEAIKGVKGGFAVGGYNRSKGVVEEYMRITPDSVRIYINQESVKGAKGGFAVGGFRPSAKGTGDDFLQVTPTSTHIFYDEELVAKGVKGGFAVGGYNRSKSTLSDQLMSLTKENYLIGHEAGLLTTGLYNTFFGYQAGMDNVGGRRNIFIGYQAGLRNVSGQENVLLGFMAGLNANGERNIILGNLAGYNSAVSNSVIIGDEAGYNSLAGWGNVIIGQRAGYNNGISGIGAARNTFVGRNSGNKNDKGDSNTYIGAYAGYDAVDGRYNTFLGDGACEDGVPGNGNVYVGYRAGLNNDGAHNVIIGREAGSAENNHSLTSNFDYNVMIGYRSGFFNKTGAGNVFIGRYAGYSEIGSDKLYIDNSSTASPLIYGDFSANEVVVNYTLKAATIVETSDARLKRTIRDLKDPLDKVLNLRGVTFRWDNTNPATRGMEQDSQVGLIAQEVKTQFPELVKETSDGYMAVSYGKLSAVLVEAIKSQQSMIDRQQELITELTRRLEVLEEK